MTNPPAGHPLTNHARPRDDGTSRRRRCPSPAGACRWRSANGAKCWRATPERLRGTTTAAAAAAAAAARARLPTHTIRCPRCRYKLRTLLGAECHRLCGCGLREGCCWQRVTNRLSCPSRRIAETSFSPAWPFEMRGNLNAPLTDPSISISAATTMTACSRRSRWRFAWAPCLAGSHDCSWRVAVAKSLVTDEQWLTPLGSVDPSPSKYPGVV